MKAADEVRGVRESVGLFRREDRGVIEVSGSERTRWLQGMLSADIEALAAGPEASGCPALLLNHRAGVIAEMHVALRPEVFWLDCHRASLAEVIERLEKFIVADDVELTDRSEDFDLLGLEGPGAGTLLARAGGPDVDALVSGAVGSVSIGGVDAVVGAWGSTGELGFRLFVPAGAGALVAGELEAKAGEAPLVVAGAAALEILRIEAGIPAMGSELDEDVLPDEARMGGAVSDSKGCYTGQEIVARLRSRGRVNHLLVGLRLEDSGDALRPGAEIRDAQRALGEVTSLCESPGEGWIALGFVRREASEPGTEVHAGACRARVVSLPFYS